MSDQLNSLVESSAESLKELRRLTAADIAASDTLQRMGAAEGDAVDMGNQQLVRDVSDEPKGQVITQSDISNSKTLQDLGAEVGDAIVDNQLVKAKDDSLWRAIEYGFYSNTNTTGTILDYVRSELPINTFDSDMRFEAGDRTGYLSLSPEERRVNIAEDRMRELQEDFADYTPDGGVGEIIGGLGKQILDPLNLTFVGRGVGGAFATGFGLGSVDSVARQAFNNEDIDLGKAATQGAIEGTIGAGLMKGIKAFQNRPKAMTKRQAMMQSSFQSKLDNGSSVDSAYKAVQKEFNLSDGEMAKQLSFGGKLRAKDPSRRKAEREFDYQLIHDPAATAASSGALGGLIGTLSTELGKIAPRSSARLRRHESEVHVMTAEDLGKVEGFTKGIDVLGSKQSLIGKPNAIREELNRHLISRNHKAAEDLIKRQAPELLEEFKVAKKFLADNVEVLRKAGYDDLEVIDNYWPRKIKNRRGLMEALGSKAESDIEDLKAAMAKRANKSIEELDEVEIDDAVDKWLRGFRANKSLDGYVLGQTKERSLDIIPQNLMKYYHDSADALEMYIRENAADVKKRELFGRNQVKTDSGVLDVRSSLGKMVREDVEAGDLTSNNLSKARQILEARFIGGERTSDGWVQVIRDVGYAGTIANPMSALTQITDLTTSVMRNGMVNTVKAVLNPKKVTAKDIGIDNASRELTEALEDPSKATSIILETLMKGAGFTRMDRFMKDSFVNASYRRLQQDVNNPKQLAKLSKRYAPLFREEWTTVVNDLKNGDITTSVKELLFSRLAEVQPVSRSEMPIAYNANPNARVFYMLKSFTLKQLDIVRREVIGQYKAGETAEATKNLLVLASMYGFLGAGVNQIKDLLRGRDLDEKEFSEEAAWSLLGVVGLNKFLADDLKNGNFTEAAASLIAPPAALIENGYKIGMGTITGDEDKLVKGASRLPVIGPVIEFLYSDSNPL